MSLTPCFKPASQRRLRALCCLRGLEWSVGLLSDTRSTATSIEQSTETKSMRICMAAPLRRNQQLFAVNCIGPIYYCDWILIDKLFIDKLCDRVLSKPMVKLWAWLQNTLASWCDPINGHLLIVIVYKYNTLQFFVCQRMVVNFHILEFDLSYKTGILPQQIFDVKWK